MLFVIYSLAGDFVDLIEFLVGLPFGCDLTGFNKNGLSALHCAANPSLFEVFLENITLFGYQLVDVSLGSVFRTLLQPGVVWLILGMLAIREIHQRIKHRKYIRILPVIPLTFGVIIIFLNFDANGGVRINEYRELNRTLFPTIAPTQAPRPTRAPPVYRPFITISEPKYNLGINLINRSTWSSSDPIRTEKDGVIVYKINSYGAIVRLGKILDKNNHPTTAQMYFQEIKKDILAKKYKVYQEKSFVVDGQWSRYINYDVDESANDCQQVIAVPKFHDQFISIWGQGNLCRAISDQIRFSNIYDNIRLKVSVDSVNGNNVYIIDGQINKQRINSSGLKIAIYDQNKKLKFTGAAQLMPTSKWINDPDFDRFEITVPYDQVSNSKWVTIEGSNPREIWWFDESEALLSD